MRELLEYIVSSVVGLGILAIGLFFTAFPGARFLRVHAYLRKLRKELEPVARAVGATTKTEWSTEKGKVMYFFVFPKEEWIMDGPGGKPISVKPWITLEVSTDGFNIYVPSFSPPREHTQDYEALVRAVRRLWNASLRS